MENAFSPKHSPSLNIFDQRLNLMKKVLMNKWGQDKTLHCIYGVKESMYQIMVANFILKQFEIFNNPPKNRPTFRCLVRSSQQEFTYMFLG